MPLCRLLSVSVLSQKKAAMNNYESVSQVKVALTPTWIKIAVASLLVLVLTAIALSAASLFFARDCGTVVTLVGCNATCIAETVNKINQLYQCVPVASVYQQNRVHIWDTAMA